MEGKLLEGQAGGEELLENVLQGTRFSCPVIGVDN